MLVAGAIATCVFTGLTPESAHHITVTLNPTLFDDWKLVDADGVATVTFPVPADAEIGSQLSFAVTDSDGNEVLAEQADVTEAADDEVVIAIGCEDATDGEELSCTVAGLEGYGVGVMVLVDGDPVIAVHVTDDGDVELQMPENVDGDTDLKTIVEAGGAIVASTGVDLIVELEETFTDREDEETLPRRERRCGCCCS